MTGDLFIAGAWTSGQGEPFAAIDPATNTPAWTGRAASAAQIGTAMAAARAAFPAWARTPLDERIAIARRFANLIEARGDALARAISSEMGKPLWDSRGEVQTVIGKIELSIASQSARAGAHEDATPFGSMALRHNPHGIMAVFGPFNFPAHLPNGHITPALLAGNVVVFKPSELAPGAGAIMAQAWSEAGLPEGVFNLVQGGREVGVALLAHPGVNGVLFTGSAPTGTAIHRHFAGRPEVALALEMGGNNPLIAWDPADAEACANLIAHSAFLTSGQRCSCARRLIVPEGGFGDRVIEALAALARAIEPAPWSTTPEPFIGPLVSARAAAGADEAVKALVGRGARAITAPQRDGAFVRPTLLAISEGMATPDEEIFAPVLQIFRARSFEDALGLANATRFGLSGGLLSDDAALWERAQTDLRAGVLNWNRPTTGASGALPFGGPGLSGNLRPSAAYAADYVAYPVAMQIAPVAKSITAPGLPVYQAPPPKSDLSQSRASHAPPSPSSSAQSVGSKSAS